MLLQMGDTRFVMQDKSSDSAGDCDFARRSRRRPRSAGHGGDSKRLLALPIHEKHSENRCRSARLSERVCEYDDFVDSSRNLIPQERSRYTQREGWIAGFSEQISPTPVSAATTEVSRGVVGGFSYEDEPKFFDVVFRPTGSLGITFEWAVDPSTCAASSLPGEAAVSAPKTSPIMEDHPHAKSKTRSQSISETTQRPPLAAEFECHDTPDVYSLSTASSRPSLSLTLPRLQSTSSSSIYSTMPHVLRIQSLPPLFSDDQPSLGGVYTAGSVDSAIGSISGNTEGRMERQWQSDQRGILQRGDDLIAVNGIPLAGPAAQAAGIKSFEQAVEAVRASTRSGRPRVLRFRRAQLPHATLPPSILPSVTAIGVQEESPEGNPKSIVMDRELASSEQAECLRGKEDSACRDRSIEGSATTLVPGTSARSNESASTSTHTGATGSKRSWKWGGGRSEISRGVSSQMSTADRIKEDTR